MNQLFVFFDHDNDANKTFFNNLKSGRGLLSLILPPVRKSRKGGKIKDTGKHAQKLDHEKIAEALGAEIIDLDMIDGCLFDKFVLTFELGVKFRETNDKIVFFKDERTTTFLKKRILRITDTLIAGKILWEQK
jgi:hypothetical protein